MDIREIIRDLDTKELSAKAREVISMPEVHFMDHSLFGFESEKKEWIYNIFYSIRNRIEFIGDDLDHVPPENEMDDESREWENELNREYDALLDIRGILKKAGYTPG